MLKHMLHVNGGVRPCRPGSEMEGSIQNCSIQVPSTVSRPHRPPPPPAVHSRQAAPEPHQQTIVTPHYPSHYVQRHRIKIPAYRLAPPSPTVHNPYIYPRSPVPVDTSRLSTNHYNQQYCNTSVNGILANSSAVGKTLNGGLNISRITPSRHRCGGSHSAPQKLSPSSCITEHCQTFSSASNGQPNGCSKSASGIKEMLISLGLLCLISLLLALLSLIFLLKISPVTATDIRELLRAEHLTVITAEEYVVVYEVTLALCALSLSLNLCCLLVCAIQFLFAVKLIKSRHGGNERTNKYLRKSSISRVCAMGGFFISIPVFLTGIILYTFIQFHSTPAIVTSIFIGLGIIFCGCAMVHNVFIWQKEKTNAVKEMARSHLTYSQGPVSLLHHTPKSDHCHTQHTQVPNHLSQPNAASVHSQHRIPPTCSSSGSNAQSTPAPNLSTVNATTFNMHSPTTPPIAHNTPPVRDASGDTSPAAAAIANISPPNASASVGALSRSHNDTISSPHELSTLV